MKTLLCLTALLATTLAYDFYSLANAEWETYKMEFGKAYTSESMEHVHMTEFLKSKQLIAEHNLKYHSGESSFKLGLNHLSDMLPEQYRRTKLGYRERVGKQRTGYRYIAPGDHIEIPSSMDWREKGGVTEVKDQGDCGSCYAFSATGAMEGQQFRKTGKLISLSEQQVVDCDRGIDQGCDGGDVLSTFQYIERYGIESEESYPYTAQEGKCQFNNSSVVATDVGHEIIAQDELEMMKVVATLGPISVAIFGDTGTFMHYTEGIYDDYNCIGHLDHAVIIVGYGTENGKDYWIVKNSWGIEWGDQGYMKIVRDKNMCCIRAAASYPLV